MKRYIGIGLFWIGFAGLFLAGCVGDEPGPGDFIRDNVVPEANAGPDLAVPSGATVQLDGSASSDPEGDTLEFQWFFIETPVGSAARFDDSTSVRPTFVADVDGTYRIHLQVSQQINTNIPDDVAIIAQGESGPPDEVVVRVGNPGPFDSANKLILDGRRVALSTFSMEVGGATDLTAEGWFFFSHIPSDEEAVLLQKVGVFEVALSPGAQPIFRFQAVPSAGAAPVTVTLTDPNIVPLNEWHHIAAVIDQQRNPKVAYLALDGKVSTVAPFTGGLGTSLRRFTIGGEAGKANWTGMAEEVRITQDVRYPITGFEPPRELLIGDNPFVGNARNTVHGLWHFDEPSGTQLFTDFSLRGNDLVLVGENGFQPFARMKFPRFGHAVARLAAPNSSGSERLWISGGTDEAGLPVEESEILQGEGLVISAARLTVLTEATLTVEKENVGRGDAVKTTFTLDFTPVSRKSVVLFSRPDTGADVPVADDAAGTLDAQGNGGLVGSRSGKINYTDGTITFDVAPPAGFRLFASYRYFRAGANREGIGSGDGTRRAFNLDFTPVVPASVRLFRRDPNTGVDTLIAEDGLGTGGLIGSQPGTIDYAGGIVTFDTLPPSGQILVADYGWIRKSGISDHTATPLDDAAPPAADRVLVAGGSDLSGVSSRAALLYTPGAAGEAGSLETLQATLQEPRAFHTAGRRSDGRVVLAGGEKVTTITSSPPRFSIETLHSIEIFDPAAETFSAHASLNDARKLHRMIALEECNPQIAEKGFWVVGGLGSDNVPLNTTEKIGADGSVIRKARMETGRYRHTLTCIPDGKVLVTGGIDRNGHVVQSAEIYDPETNQMTTLGGKMIFPRADHTATLLPNNKILIAGGYDQVGEHGSAEIYDPILNNFTLVQNRGVGRFGHVGLLWRDVTFNKEGVLIVGGIDSQGARIGLMEIFYP